MKLTTAQIDRINIGLMLLSLIPAFLLPFQCFLFVYAFLGPLHYLTEINWLHQKQYFTAAKSDYRFIIIATLLVGILVFFKLPLRAYVSVITFTVFAAALGFVLFKTVKAKVLFTLGSLMVGIALLTFFPKYFRIAFSTLMPTLIHVFVFTGLFILVGALKSNSKTGLASLCIFVFCALATLLAGTHYTLEIMSEQIRDNHASFIRVNKVMLALFNAFDPDTLSTAGTHDGYRYSELPVYFSDAGIRVMRFIAFAYTYHYLNWFSKTSVIQWHNTKKINLIAILLLWVASVVLYIADYKTGLKWLFLLSFGHVLLEFPLNHRSFIEIKQRLQAKFTH